MPDLIKAILFDKDGTLLDFDATWAPANAEAARLASGGDLDLAERLMRRVGLDPRTLKTEPGSLLAAGNSREIAETWVDAGAVYQVDALTGILDRMADEAMRQAAALPGILNAVAELARDGYRLGVASSDSEAAIRTFLDENGLSTHIGYIAGYDSGFGPKPEPGMLNGFAEATALPASAIAVIGDSTHDLEMATRAGAGLKIGVLSGTGRNADLEPMADVVLASVADLPAFLGERHGAPHP